MIIKRKSNDPILHTAKATMVLPLIGKGRIKKTDIRMEALGSVDEASGTLGLPDH
jgi:hypothetical protein